MKLPDPGYPAGPLGILEMPDPRLRAQAKPVASIDDGLRGFLDRMLDAMYAAPGIGLAAPQVGVLARIVVVDVAPKDEPRSPIRLINPEIVWRGATRIVAEEGCLSLPGHYADVERPEAVTVRFVDHTGEPGEIEAEGLLARCLQHEVDHLDGILFVDHLSALKRGMILRKLAKNRRTDRRSA
jgi:peptide deformylase